MREEERWAKREEETLEQEGREAGEEGRREVSFCEEEEKEAKMVERERGVGSEGGRDRRRGKEQKSVEGEREVGEQV